MAWKTIDVVAEDGLLEWQVDYDKEKGMYRVSEFLDNHFKNEIIFDTYNDLKEGLEQAIEIEKCDFCHKIPLYNQEWEEQSWDEKGSGLMRTENGEIVYYVGLDDDYYNHIGIYNVKYCPCCGRKLI